MIRKLFVDHQREFKTKNSELFQAIPHQLRRSKFEQDSYDSKHSCQSKTDLVEFEIDFVASKKMVEEENSNDSTFAQIGPEEYPEASLEVESAQQG